MSLIYNIYLLLFKKLYKNTKTNQRDRRESQIESNYMCVWYTHMAYMTYFFTYVYVYHIHIHIIYIYMWPHITYIHVRVYIYTFLFKFKIIKRALKGFDATNRGTNIYIYPFNNPKNNEKFHLAKIFSIKIYVSVIFVC